MYEVKEVNMANPKLTKAVKIDRVTIMLLPMLLAFVFYFVINKLCIKYEFVIDKNSGVDDFKTILSIWGTLLGFLITAVSILLTLGNGKFLDMLKATGHYKTILLSYVACCLHLLVAIIFATVCIFCQIWSMQLFSIMCAIAIDTSIMVAVCIFFLFVLVIRLND